MKGSMGKTGIGPNKHGGGGIVVATSPKTSAQGKRAGSRPAPGARVADGGSAGESTRKSQSVMQGSAHGARRSNAVGGTYGYTSADKALKHSSHS